MGIKPEEIDSTALGYSVEKKDILKRLDSVQPVEPVEPAELFLGRSLKRKRFSPIALAPQRSVFFFSSCLALAPSNIRGIEREEEKKISRSKALIKMVTVWFAAQNIRSNKMMNRGLRESSLGLPASTWAGGITGTSAF